MKLPIALELEYHSLKIWTVWKTSVADWRVEEHCRWRASPNSREYFSSLDHQMQRAAISIPSNIAEGSERDSKLDYIRFLAHCQRFSRGTANAMLHRIANLKS